MHSLMGRTLRVLALCQASLALTATTTARILADTNRDGQVDDADAESKDFWTPDRGALLLPNIGDTDQRCSKLLTPNVTDDTIDDCNDAADNVLRNPKFLAPLRTAPLTGLDEDSRGYLNITNEVAAEKVRIFVKLDDHDEWEYVSSSSVFTAYQISSGLELGIDARDVRRQNVWDGRVTVKFTVISGESLSTDAVALRVAPVLTHHHAQLAERVFTTSESELAQSQKQYNIDLQQEVEKAGISEPVQKFDYYDMWTQDFFEPAYSSMPGPDGPVVIRIMIRSFQQRDSGAQVFTDLRSSGVGAVQQLSPGTTTDSTGNLEAIPPYTYQGKSYPAGRIIMGSQQGQLPFVFEFLQAQETQDPIELDTSWLAVGHVDEFVQFLPAPHTKRGWVMMADDPLAGLELLKKVVEDGHGEQKAYSRPRLPTDDLSWPLKNVTLKEHLSKPNFTKLNEVAAERIQYNIDIIKTQTGITDDEIFRVPSTFYRVELFDSADSVSSFQAASTRNKVPPVVQAAAIHKNILQRRQQPEDPWLLSSWPSIINGVVLSDSYYLAPKPWGPIVDGKDVLEEAATKVYAAAANYSISFMDDWFSHHMGGGEIHCGSNVWRNANAPWW